MGLFWFKKTESTSNEAFEEIWDDFIEYISFMILNNSDIYT